MHKVTLAWQKYWGGWKRIFSGIESVKNGEWGGKKYSLAGGALSAKMKAGGSKCGIGDALTRELHLPSQ